MMALIFFVQGLFFCIIAISCLLQAGNSIAKTINASFWGAYGILTIGGAYIPAFLSATFFILLLILPPFVKPLSQQEKNRHEPDRHPLNAFFPLLFNSMILFTSLMMFQLPDVSIYLQRFGSTPTQIAVSGSAILSLVAGTILTRTRLTEVAKSAELLVGRMGPSLVLPQTLAALGALIGLLMNESAQSEIITYLRLISTNEILIIYVFACFILTAITGSAFAAFPVCFSLFNYILLTGTVSPSNFAALGMLAGYCGTLITPLAANFNIIPARLLEINNSLDVIKAQIPTALVAVVICMIQLML